MAFIYAGNAPGKAGCFLYFDGVIPASTSNGGFGGSGGNRGASAKLKRSRDLKELFDRISEETVEEVVDYELPAAPTTVDVSAAVARVTTILEAAQEEKQVRIARKAAAIISALKVHLEELEDEEAAVVSLLF